MKRRADGFRGRELMADSRWRIAQTKLILSFFCVPAVSHKPYVLFFGQETHDKPAGRPAMRCEMLDCKTRSNSVFELPDEVFPLHRSDSSLSLRIPGISPLVRSWYRSRRWDSKS